MYMLALGYVNVLTINLLNDPNVKHVIKRSCSDLVKLTDDRDIRKTTCIRNVEVQLTM